MKFAAVTSTPTEVSLVSLISKLETSGLELLCTAEQFHKEASKLAVKGASYESGFTTFLNAHITNWGIIPVHYVKERNNKKYMNVKDLKSYLSSLQ